MQTPKWFLSRQSVWRADLVFLHPFLVREVHFQVVEWQSLKSTQLLVNVLWHFYFFVYTQLKWWGQRTTCNSSGPSFHQAGPWEFRLGSECLSCRAISQTLLLGYFRILYSLTIEQHFTSRFSDCLELEGTWQWHFQWVPVHVLILNIL